MPSRTSYSSAETKNIAADMARGIFAAGPGKIATIIALEGDLGAGKTTFVQGFFRGSGLKRAPTSPTFILMRRTAISRKPFRNIFHIDAYRADAEAFTSLGIKEIFSDPRNIVLIEWPEKIKKLLPRKIIRVRFAHGQRADERKLIVPASNIVKA